MNSSIIGNVKWALKKHLPSPVVSIIRDAKRAIRKRLPWLLVKAARRAIFFGMRHTCPVCGSTVRRLLPSHVPDDTCPVCNSSQRTRLVWLYLSRHTDLFDAPRHVLHIAPERGIAEHLVACPSIDYVAGDFDPGQYLMPKGMLRVDLTEMQFADDEFDVIICNHVLEHIPDDRTAMAELLRVLRPGGFAVLLVPDPHKLERTIEDPDAPPEERARRFGQADHVRLYGADYEDRLKEAGFGVRIWMARDAEPELCRQWALDPIERVYIGTKA